MNDLRLPRRTGCLTFVLVLMWTGPLLAQTFSSGSTGALGAFNPTSNVTVTLPPDGILHYTTINVPAGVTVTFQRNAMNTPVAMLATGDVTIAGTISVNGANGTNNINLLVQALGGPGGFSGGISGAIAGSPPTGGAGPGGGGSGGGFGDATASSGVPASFVSLLPLFGGSGGGGGVRGTFDAAGGGGGGGAIVIASSTRITIPSTGRVSANGGFGAFGSSGNSFAAGGGSGGAIRMVAPEVTGTGTLEANGGASGATGGIGAPGRIRLESFTPAFTGSVNPPASISAAPGPVTAASNPGLIKLPTVTISSVGSLTPPGTPGGSYATADVSLPAGTTNPVPVVLTATNLPPNTSFTVRLIPRNVAPSTVTASPLAGGTFDTSTYQANLTLPTGQVSLLQAFGSFTLPQIASLFPLIDGEEVERVMVAAAYGEPSSVTLVTTSGREMPVDRLSNQDQVHVAMAFEALRMAGK